MPASPDAKRRWLEFPSRERPPLVVYVSKQEDHWKDQNWDRVAGVPSKKTAGYDLATPSGTHKVELSVQRVERDSRICRIDITTTPLGQKRASDPETVYVNPDQLLFVSEAQSAQPFLAVRIDEWKVTSSDRSHLNLQASTTIVPVDPE